MRKVSPEEKLRAYDLKLKMWNDAGCRCKHCDEFLFFEQCEQAHKIPKWGWLIEKYGPEIIFDEDNMDITCHDCNSKSNLNPASNPLAVEALAASIKEKLDR